MLHGYADGAVLRTDNKGRTHHVERVNELNDSQARSDISVDFDSFHLPSSRQDRVLCNVELSDFRCKRNLISQRSGMIRGEEVGQEVCNKIATPPSALFDF